MSDPSSHPRNLEAVAQRHGFSASAVREAFRALVQGNGRAAQFAHPELGGSGQWMPGMTMIGDMFDSQLRARVEALFSELAAMVKADVATPTASLRYEMPAPAEQWYPRELGTPASLGEQNGVRYAWFPQTARLAVELSGRLTVYATGHHQIHSVQAAQSGEGGTLAFTSQDGAIDLSRLPVVETRDAK
jgi:hypothetical protein